MAEHNFTGPTHVGANFPDRYKELRVKCPAIIARIRTGDESAVEELYTALHSGIHFLAVRRVGPEYAEDIAQDVFLQVIEAIKTDQIRNHEALPAYTLGVAKIKCLVYLKSNWRNRRVEMNSATEPAIASNPETYAVAQEHVTTIRLMLRRLPPLYRDILKRFYFEAQSAEQIMAELNMSETQFRLTKWRAKSKFAEICRSTVGRRRGTLAASALNVDNTNEVDGDVDHEWLVDLIASSKT